ncbi:ROK family protein [Streptomyces durmitorensis]|uniref:ROK family protein n=1 Tax=Streptomyces durmitorensis TaxID=319947 RepID=A0ABY4PNY5_9ACTN|nr:ROK family protein [Streptomyces durmitorensis]UQT54869.1 ROK family protein [Streptomyces durmitorensis]
MRAVLEIGGTHVTAALVDPLRTRVRRRIRRPLDARGKAEHILGTVVRCAGELRAPAGQVWAAAVPGPFDHEKGIARFEGVGKFDDLYGIDVRSVLIDGVWPRPTDVVFLNDAHAFALGEWRAGAAAGHRRCVGITLGTGVGSAFLTDGAVRREGPGVPPEGRVDLLTWAGAPLEHSVSRRAILARYGGHDVDVRDIAVRAREGERWAGQVLAEALAALGAVIAPCVRDFDASALVVGGAMALSWDLVGPAIGTGLGDTPVRARPGTLGADAALIGAAEFVGAARR